jgi:hypothetical protein
MHRCAALFCTHLGVVGAAVLHGYWRLLAIVSRLVCLCTKLHHHVCFVDAQYVFSSLKLVAAISRLLVAEAKSIELTPERLLKKYAQVRVHTISWRALQRLHVVPL